MSEGYFKARFKGSTVDTLQTNSIHIVLIRRRMFQGYSATPCHGYNQSEVVRYRAIYASLAQLIEDWELIKASKD